MNYQRFSEMSQQPPPVGFRFVPTDQEIILQYLFNKANDSPLPSEAICDDCDVYGDHEMLWKKKFLETKARNLFFFSKSRNHSGNAFRTDRVSSTGTWKETQKKIDIKSKGETIGVKVSFQFIPKEGFSVETRWLMDEFRLVGRLLDSVKDKSLVVCKVERKNKLPSRIRDKEDVMTPEFAPSTLRLHVNHATVEGAIVTQTTTALESFQEKGIQSSNTVTTSTDDSWNGNTWTSEADSKTLLSDDFFRGNSCLFEDVETFIAFFEEDR